jgi:hypothetical protein
MGRSAKACLRGGLDPHTFHPSGVELCNLMFHRKFSAELFYMGWV